MKDTDAQKFDESWNSAIRLRRLTLGTIAQGQDILGLIDSTETWSWARNPQNKGKLTSMLGELRAGMTEFHRSLLGEDPATIKKRHSREYILAELRTFDELKTFVQLLGEFIRLLLRRHKS